MKLNDKEIREAFIARLKRHSPAPKRIIEELSVDNGNAIADIVAISNDLHCYEIKGENDKPERLNRQAVSYNLAFRKVTLITTDNHLLKAWSIVPPHWGLIEAKYVSEKIKFCYHRKASINPRYSKYIALQTLWKEEMLRIAVNRIAEPLKKTNTRDFISTVLADKNTKKELSNLIAKQLQAR
jgi:hypothetical protein